MQTTSQVRCKLQRGLLHHLKMTWTLVHKRLQIGSEFSPTLRKICIPLHCQASQTEISKRNSSTSKRWTVALTICRSKVGVVSPEKIGAKKILQIFGSSRTSRLNGEYLLKERDTDSRQGRWKVRRVSYVVRKFHELWSTNGLKPDRSFYLPSLYRFVLVYRTPCMRH